VWLRASGGDEPRRLCVVPVRAGLCRDRRRGMSGWFLGFVGLVVIAYVLLIAGALYWLPYDPEDHRGPR